MQAALWLFLMLPSLFVVDKYGGGAAASLYVVGSALAVFGLSRYQVRMSPKALRAAALTTLAAVVVLFLLVYPRVNSQLPGVRSDDDDAYNVGVRALLAFQSPYETTTYLGNVLHQLPGAFLLAAPFVVLLGTSAWQNLFWLPVFFLLIRKESSNAAGAMRAAWLVLFAAPVVLHQVLTGTGHVANALYVLVGLWWVIETGGSALAALVWGVALASRANFLFLVPIVAGWLFQHRGAATAVRSTALTLLAVAVLVLPFYLHDPAHFGPLEAANRLQRIDAWVPHGGEAVAAVMGMLAVALGCTRLDRRRLFAYCAIVQFTPILLVTIVEIGATGRVDLAYVAYAVFAMPFVVMAASVRRELAGSPAVPADRSVCVSKGSQAAAG